MSIKPFKESSYSTRKCYKNAPNATRNLIRSVAGFLGFTEAVGCLGLIGFGLLGAYSLCAGVLSLEFRASAAACGFADA